MTRLLTLLLSISISTLLLLTACNPKARDTRPLLTVSVEPLRYVATQIAGPGYRINSLTPAGASPEMYEPTPRQMAELQLSTAYISLGAMGFERTRLERLAKVAPEVPALHVTKGIKLLLDLNHKHEGHSHDTPHDHSDSTDPHVWLSAENMQIIATNLCAELSKLQPDSAAVFTRNLEAFKARTQGIDEYVRNRVKNLQNRHFLIYHPALAYFARDYGLRQLSVERDGKEPSAARMAELLEDCRRKGVQTVFVSKEQRGETARRMAEQLGARLVEINPLNAEWDIEMKRIADELAHGN